MSSMQCEIDKVVAKSEVLTAMSETCPTSYNLVEKAGILVPEWWSDNAAAIAASRYANLQLKEGSAVNICLRIATGWVTAGIESGHFNATKAVEMTRLYANIMLMQLAAPNSPQWFNTGIYGAGGRMKSSGNWVFRPESGAFQPEDAWEYPQVHACFINEVQDKLVGEDSIDDLWTKETKIFKHGSGSGANMSRIRQEGAPLSGGGTSSGLMSFLKVGDSNAGAIKSGGTTRRAALMRTLDIDHPDIIDFIRWKRDEEAKVAYLAEGSKIVTAAVDGEQAGGVSPEIQNRIQRMKEEGIIDGQFAEMNTGWTSDAYRTVDGQNSNNSIMVTDEFMKAVDNGDDWDLVCRVTGEAVKSVPAREIWDEIAESAWLCADPAVQYRDTINRENTAKNTGGIEGSNPCCFVGETLVDTSEGAISIAELARMDAAGEELPLAFCWNEGDSLPDLRKINKAWVAGETKELVRVTTDSGKEFLCTPEHRWLLRSGEWIEAKELEAGDSLRKVKRYINHDRSSRRYISHRCTDKAPNGQQILSRWMWEKAYGAIPDGMQVHHINEDPTDDRLSNFELVERGEHQSMHSKGLNNPHAYSVTDQDLVEVYDAVSAMKLDGRGKSHNGTVTASRWNKYLDRNNLGGVIPRANIRGLQGLSWDEFHKKMDEVRGTVNDRVASVEIVEERRLVYDIEVEGTHNFGIKHREDDKDSIVVHNSEYVYLNNTACNLASINLAELYRFQSLTASEQKLRALGIGDDSSEEGRNIELWQLAYLMTVILDVSVDMASYPTAKIAETTYRHRTLGLGFTALGEWLAILGAKYDSDVARALGGVAARSIYSGALEASVCMGEHLGRDQVVYDNEEHLREVIGRKINDDGSIYEGLLPRNMQLTNVAPTGTISFVMDAGSTGIEPVYALKTWKTLSEGGGMEVVAPFVQEAVAAVIRESDQHEALSMIEDGEVPLLLKGVLATANTVSWQGHVDMMAAVQKYVCGAISKTVNLPEHATIDDIKNVYKYAHEEGVKCISIYRDKSKLSQPMNEIKKEKSEDVVIEADYVDGSVGGCGRGERESLPAKRKGYTQKVKIDSQSMYIQTGEYADGTLGEIFLSMGRQGGAYGGMLGAFAKAVSIGLQYGVPLSVFCDAFIGERFQPSGFVFGHDDVKMCTSPVDLLFKDLENSYGNINPDNTDRPSGDGDSGGVSAKAAVSPTGAKKANTEPCPECGGFNMVSTGTCSTCKDCGATTGCA